MSILPSHTHQGSASSSSFSAPQNPNFDDGLSIEFDGDLLQQRLVHPTQLSPSSNIASLRISDPQSSASMPNSVSGDPNVPIARIWDYGLVVINWVFSYGFFFFFFVGNL
uniref:Uncharacterized protein n=1 Tax=Opuntia streptacantha TaxID=393608 RepID=A0A7C8ZAZ1_OPUST